MPAKRTKMRKIKEVLRLYYDCHLSYAQISGACQLSTGVISKYIHITKQAGLTWPLPPDVTENQLESLLYEQKVAHSRFIAPDYAVVHKELMRKGVTLQLLWEEHSQQHGSRASKYGLFCKGYRAWCQVHSATMRLDQKAGEKLYVDYAGQTVPIHNPHTGEIRSAQLFVAALGVSSFTYAEATWTQSLPDWISSHVRVFDYLGGVPAQVVPDNLKSAVIKAHRYDPDLNVTYTEMAEHYGVAVVPARVRKPRDKAKVESAVLLSERWILAVLRHRTFFSLEELNQAIRLLLDKLNHRAFKKRPGSRKEQFEQVDKPALKTLPASPYSFAEWRKTTIQRDYHVEVERCFYSVPYQYIGKKCDLRITPHSIECFYKAARIAAHVRLIHSGSKSTLREHMPLNHRNYHEWTPASLHAFAHTVGPSTESCMQKYVFTKNAQIRGLKIGIQLWRLSKEYSSERLEAACTKALAMNTVSIESIRSLLEKKLEQWPLPSELPPLDIPTHSNIRGANYFQYDTKKEGENHSPSSWEKTKTSSSHH